MESNTCNLNANKKLAYPQHSLYIKFVCSTEALRDHVIQTKTL